MKTYRFGSSDLVFAPGIFQWAKAGWAFKSDRKRIAKVLDSWGVNLDWDKVFSQELTIDGDVVVVTQ